MNPKTLTVQWIPFKKEFRVLVKEEANWRFRRMISLDIPLAEYRPLNSSSEIELAKFTKSKEAVVNIKNCR